MGRIKTALIKRVTKKLVREYGDRLTTSFEENKKVVDDVAIVQSKKLRNVIAGYATRLTKRKEEF